VARTAPNAGQRTQLRPLQCQHVIVEHASTPMTTLVYMWTNTKFFFVALVISVVTGLAMQKFSPALILALYVLPSLIVLFYYYPMALVALWFVLAFVVNFFPNMMNEVGSFFLIPMDPAYFFSVVFLSIYALARSKEFIRAIKANPFLTIFLAVILVYILMYMPLHGKSALGEARKGYFLFFFPLLIFLSTKTCRDLRRLMLLIFFLTLSLLTVSLIRFTTLSSLKEAANAEMSLVFLFMIFSILIFHRNGKVFLGRIIDITILAFCFTLIALTQHRSVLITIAFGILLMCVLSQNKMLFIPKIGFGLITLLVVMTIILSYIPEFERKTIERLNGIINPYSDNTASWRLRGWTSQFNAFSTNDLLLGQGLGSYYRAFNSSNKYAPITERQVAPHSTYVQTIANFGLLGLVIYELLAFWFFWKTFAVRRTLPRGTMRAYVEMSILNFGASQAFMLGYSFCFPILIFLGMGMSTVKLLEDSSQDGEQDEEWKILQGQID
jgi:hypothetical protein